MTTTETSRHVTECYGVVVPGAWYTEEGMLAAVGIGRTQLIEARADGYLKSKIVGRRLMYSGAEIIRYIESCPDRDE